MNKRVITLRESDLRNIIEGAVKKCLSEGSKFKNNDNYTHFAVGRNSGKILNGWDKHLPNEKYSFILKNIQK